MRLQAYPISRTFAPSEAARADGRAAWRRASRRGLPPRARGRPDRGALRPGAHHARLHLGAGAAAGPLRQGAGCRLPGGCAIGARPIDLHLRASRTWAPRSSSSTAMSSPAPSLKGARVVFDVPQRGRHREPHDGRRAGPGRDHPRERAREPEIVDLARALAHGRQVEGEGTEIIRIQGVARAHGCDIAVMPDRIEAGTFLIAAAASPAATCASTGLRLDL